jgi:hypothetical protein
VEAAQMSDRPHKNDISIGKDRWITAGDLGTGQTDAVEIDHHLATVMPFIEGLETECVAECCGIDAFGLWPDSIRKVLANMGKADISKLIVGLTAAQNAIAQMPSDIVVSTRMNQYFRKEALLEILSHMRSVVENA